MKAGDTFRIPQPGTSLDSHLWIVISNPAIDEQKVLIVNFTTRREDSDTACVLQAGEHPFVKHETCVNYAGAKVVSKGQLETLLKNGLLSNHAAISEPLLKRIRDGAAASARMALDHASILIEQGIIDS